jgi:hypothetical protein
MTSSNLTSSLGFTEQLFPGGVHVCQIITSDDERQESLLKFLLAGLHNGEQVCCFSEQINESVLKEFLGNYGISFNDVVDSGALTFSGAREVYFQDNRFDPDRMLALVEKYHKDSEIRGYPAARAIGEMLPEVQNIPGGSRLLEYEARISLLLEKHPVTAVCQYDARQFDGATIMDILKVHPWMAVRKSVLHNPFYIPPEKFLAAINYQETRV